MDKTTFKGQLKVKYNTSYSTTYRDSPHIFIQVSCITQDTFTTRNVITIIFISSKEIRIDSSRKCQTEEEEGINSTDDYVLRESVQREGI